MTAAITRRRDADFGEFFELRSKLREHVAAQQTQVAADRLDARVRRAIQERACRMLRAYETAATIHHHRHTMTGQPTPAHEARDMERLHADWLESNQQIREYR